MNEPTDPLDDPTFAALLEEFLARTRRGAGPSVEDYAARHPELAGPIRELFPTLLVLQGHRRDPEIDPAWLAAVIDAQIPTGHGGSSPTSDVLALSPPPDLPAIPQQLPAEFGRYRLVKLLGRGGMGAVFLAEDSQLGRTVALKMPRLEGSPPGLIERFRREARIAATFHHPNLCPVYDFGQINGLYYLTMPLLRGEPLSAVLRREGRLAPPRAALLAARLARAVQAAHAAGVLHRDLKPGNVMIDEQGEPVVLDFGLAYRPATADTRLTVAGGIVGTAAYLPPEQVGGAADALGPACDVYGLGAVLYELLTGRPPFEGSVGEILRQVLSQEPEPPSRIVRGLDPVLEGVCLKALAKDPAARFASMDAFAQALEHALAADPPPAPKGAAGKWRPSRRLVVITVVGAVAACLAGIARPLGRWFVAAPPADAVQPGSRWSGRARWLPALTDGFPITLVIHERNGESFQGSYGSVNGAERYEWHIAGTVRQGVITWHFTKVVQEPRPTGVVEKAHVEGTVTGETIEATYRDADSQARLELQLQK
jgi:hypothetical protein